MPKLVKSNPGPAKSIFEASARFTIVPQGDIDLRAAKNLGLEDYLNTPLLEEEARPIQEVLNNEANRLRAIEKSEREKGGKE